MSQTAIAVSPQKLVLILKKEQPESERALELVRDYDPGVEVVYVTNGADRTLPCLRTPLSAFEGLSDIEGFLQAERQYPIVKRYLKLGS